MLNNNNNNTVFSSKDDNLESIIEKIKSGDNDKNKIVIYSMFKITRPEYTTAINISLQIGEPELWKKIKKAYYPSLWDKIMNKLNK